MDTLIAARKLTDEAERAAVEAEFLATPEARAFWDGSRYYAWRDRTLSGEARDEAHRRFFADEAASTAEREARNAAKEAEALAWRQNFVAYHGDDSQRTRFAAGMLPAHELEGLVADVTFAGLASFPPYQQINAWDIPCECDGDYCEPDHCEPAFSSYPAFVAVTAEEFAHLQALRAACAADERLVGAEVELRLHTGTRSGCDGETARKGIMVEVQAGPYHLRREFAATA